MKSKLRFVFTGLFALVLVLASGITVFAQDDLTEQLSQLRRQRAAAGARTPIGELPLRPIDSDREPITRDRPPDMSHLLIPIEYGVAADATPNITPPPYTLGARRRFFASGMGATSTRHWATLVRQSNYVNVWILDAVPASRRPTDAQLNAAMPMYDDITRRMTRDFAPFRNVRVVTRWSNIPMVGDVHRDGRINLLMHEGSSGGYFWSWNFFTDHGNAPIAVFHMNPQHFDNAGLFAHELQHLLWYMHFGVYNTGENQPYLWFDEGLAELAWVYWAWEGYKNIDPWQVRDAMPNSYSNPGDGRIGDFVNFNNSWKNYSMSMFYAMLMHDITGGRFATDVYRFIGINFPPATNSATFIQNQNRITQMGGMRGVIGNTLRFAGITHSQGEAAFREMYFMFMENFAADGGSVVYPTGAWSVSPFIRNTFSAFNFWGWRPNLGIPHSSGVIDGQSVWGINAAFRNADSAIGAGNQTRFTLLNSGGRVQMSGFNGTPPLGATHESFFRLNQGTQNQRMLNISTPDNNANTRFYVVILNEPAGTVSHSNNMHFGSRGADVHLLQNNNAANQIYVGDRTAFLFVATYFRNVNAIVTYDWSVYVREGWVQTGGQWFFYVDGNRQMGWLEIGGAWFYFIPEAGGAAAIGEVLVDGRLQYFHPNGAWSHYVTGWLEIGGQWFFFVGGHRQMGWLEIGGSWFYFIPEADGAAAIGEVFVDGRWQYFLPNGAWSHYITLEGWQLNDGIWFFYIGGTRVIGWHFMDGAWFYFLPEQNGAVAIGAHQIGGVWQYFHPNGAWSHYIVVELEGWQLIDGIWFFYIAGNRHMGWHFMDGNWFYFLPEQNGAVAIGAHQIGGVWQYFLPNGAWSHYIYGAGEDWQQIGDELFFYTDGSV